MRRKQASNPSEQSKKFIEKAKELGCDESEAGFEKQLEEIAQHQPEPEKAEK